jgi:hypothetical protein
MEIKVEKGGNNLMKSNYNHEDVIPELVSEEDLDEYARPSF